MPRGTKDYRITNAIGRFSLDRYPIQVQVSNVIEEVPRLEDSYAYEVRVSKEGIEIRADTTWGAITACSVLAALAWRDGSLPFCHLVDEPVYSWRGLMIDTSRHFISIPTLKQTVELMACYRLNVLHLNLSNDQACRFRSKRFPLLAQTESYSSEDLRDLITFAADRGIRVVPELDVPGHTTNWVWAYPEWGAGELEGPSTGFGVHEACLDPTKPEVLEAIKHVFKELADVFPDSHVHVGGDEVNATWWDRNSRIQAWMTSRGMTTSHELQTWFITELADHLVTLGKRVVGWDEVLAEQLPQQFVIQAWRGTKARDAARESGHATIVSAPYYLDLFLPADYHYRYEPSMSTAAAEEADAQVAEDSRLAHVADGLRWQANFGAFPSLKKRDSGDILGGEACMWSEIVDGDTLHTRVWSRMPAIAERFWSGNQSIEESRMYDRLERGVAYWREKLSINSLMRMPHELSPPELQPLIQQLEPVKWYARLIGMRRVRARTSGQVESSYARPYDVDSELNRVIDFLPPESFEARRVKAAIRDSLSLDEWCEGWRNQKKALDEYAAKEPRLAELKEASHRLSSLAEIHQGKLPVDMTLVEPVGEYLLPVAAPLLHEAIRRIARRFGANDGVVEEITKGHINDTFVVDEEVLLQRINSSVFDVSAVLNNRRKLEPVIRDFVPAYLETTDGRDHVVGVNGEVWRAAQFIKARNFDVLPTELCEAAGLGFGGFLSNLRNCTEPPQPVILGFHDIDVYLSELDSLKATADGRDCIEFVTDHRSSLPPFDRGEFHVIHGDCKVNNLLFEIDVPHVKKIVDLDTILWGHPAWDFGDLIRSVLTGKFDKTEANGRIRAITTGFVKGYEIDRQSVESFAHAPAYMSFMLGVRFLADHFRGDTYFKVSDRGDNLNRAKEQFALSERLAQVASDLHEWLQEKP